MAFLCKYISYTLFKEVKIFILQGKDLYNVHINLSKPISIMHVTKFNQGHEVMHVTWCPNFKSIKYYFIFHNYAKLANKLFCVTLRTLIEFISPVLMKYFTM